MTKKDQPIAFKAEIKQLLNILIHSLYTEREIFLRELISNASDALTQMHFISLTDREIHDPDIEFAIRLDVDEEAKTITISDTGVGMTREELIENLGTIAQSGARAFIEASEAGQQNLADIIGQFGVGFYSVFMVAEWVRVTSRSYQPEAEAASWYATGEDTFTVEDAEKADRGTVIEVKLNEDAAEFASEHRLREVVKKHSDYIAYPIYIGESEEQVNRQTAIWRQSPREVESEEYTEFYRHLTLEFEDPLAHLHYVADAPLQVYSLLFFPAKPEHGVFSTRKEDGLKLYAQKVLIQEYTTDLLPQYYRFIQGVVDAEDIPLNVSRESVQATAVMARLKKIITSQVTNKLSELASKETDTYETFWERFGVFIKEGIAVEQVEKERETLYPLLRFRTTTHPDQWVSLNDYVARLKLDQKKIYYILGDDARSAIRSPHLDYFQRHGYEVFILTDPVDSFMLLGLREFEGFKLQNVAAGDLEFPEGEEAEEAEPLESLPEDALSQLIERFKAQLGERVTDVRTTEVLSDSVARLVDPEGSLGQEMQRVYRMMDRDYEVPKKVLELNPRHPILTNLSATEEDSPVSQAVIEQIYESALLIEGLHPDPASMLPRIQKLMEAALGQGKNG
jgi:HSP90 family molecular chaperone